MLIDSNWIVVSGSGAIVQIIGIGAVLVKYAVSQPTDDTGSVYEIRDEIVHKFPAATGMALYMRATSEPRQVSVQPT